MRMRGSSGRGWGGGWGHRWPAVVLTAALLIAATSSSFPSEGFVPLLAADGGMGYRLVDTWDAVHAGHVETDLPWPSGHAIGGLGSLGARILATDRSADVVRIFEGAREVEALAGSGTAPGQLRDAHDVLALPDGRIVVADSGNDRLQLLAADGRPLRSWPVARPLGLTLYDEGSGQRIAVVAGAGREIVGVDPDGGIVLRLPLARMGMPERIAWGGLRALGGATFYVTDALPQSAGIHQVDSRVSIRHALRGVGAVAGPEVSSAAFLPPEALLAGLDGDGVLPLSQLARFRAGRATTAELSRVRDLEITGSGELYAAVPGRGVVGLGDEAALRHDLERQHSPQAGPQVIAAGAEVLFAGGHARVHARELSGSSAWQLPLPTGSVDVAVDGGARFVLTDDGIVQRVGPGVEPLRSRAWRDEQHHAVALDAAGGRVALLDLRAQEVRLLDARLRQRAALALAPEGAFRGIVDVALTPSRVLLARASAGRVEIRDLDGRAVAEAVVPSGAIRVAAGPEGELVALSAAGWALRFAEDGRVLAAWPAGAPEDSPVDLAVGARGLVYVADAGGHVRVYAPDPDAPSETPPLDAARCTVLANKGATPAEIALGDEVEVTLSLEGACPREERRSDVVLAIDRSASMRGAKLASAQDAALAFAAQMDPLLARVAVVGFAGRAERLLSLTSDRARIIDAVLGIEIEEWTDVVAALEAAHEALVGGLGRPDARRVVVLLTDGRHWDPLRGEVVDPAALPAVLAELRAADVELFAVGLGDDANAPLLRTIAGDEAHYLRSPTPGDLRAVYRDIARRIEATELLRELELRDVVPPDMTYLAGSGRPQEPIWEPGTRSLIWRLDSIPEPGLRLHYKLRPTRAGLRPTNVEAHSRFVDGFGHSGEVEHPVPRVRVIDPDAPPSPDPMGHRAWLPIALAERCTAERLHVVLLLDGSTSMAGPLGPSPGAPTKASAQADAVLAFVDSVDAEGAELSVLSFAESAKLIARGGDRARIEAALSAHRLRPGTRLDRALSAAARELSLAGALTDPTTLPVVLLLTDGLPSAGSEGAAREAAAAVRASGAALYAVALGADADLGFLAELAGIANVHAVDDAVALRSLYTEIALGIRPCPPSWGRRSP